MDIGAQKLGHIDDVIDVIIKIEAAVFQRHRARVGPIGNIHVVGR